MTNVDSILKPLTKLVAKLDKVVSILENENVIKGENINKLKRDMADNQSEMVKAISVSEKLKELFQV